jgi:L-cystine uptake protein TcyP (sodium:dicarboxylate symporter family)
VRSLGAVSAGVLGVLLTTTAISALIGVTVARLFGLRADGLVQGARELEKAASLTAKVGEAATLTIPALLQSFAPANAFADLAGTRPTSVIGVVVFATLLGVAALALRADDPEAGARVQRGVDTLQLLVQRLVRIVVRLTPYGVLALMTRVVATSSVRDVVQLGAFVVASYVGLAAILLVHATVVALAGVSPVRFCERIWPTLTFAFTSRSSAATIPLNVDAQVCRLGVAPAVANVAATFGATIGQNACAGLYPAMLAVMIAPSAGVDPTSWSFVGSVAAVAALGSFGIAGVGGGATFAALVVLSTLGLPVALAGLLISVEPLIDMGRTAVNVSGSMVAGAVTSRLLGQMDARALADGAPAPPPVDAAPAPAAAS